MQQGWELWSADISEAFLRGLTFEELHERGGQLRDVQISLPPGEEFLLRAIEGYEDLDAATEILVLVKPGFGLRDAPRLWLLALKKVLTRIGVTACQGDQQLFHMRENGRLSLLMTIHVDDIKMCGQFSSSTPLSWRRITSSTWVSSTLCVKMEAWKSQRHTTSLGAQASTN